MNYNDRREMGFLLSDYVDAKRDRDAKEQQGFQFTRLENFVDGQVARSLSRAVDAETAIRVDHDTARSRAESLTRLLHMARRLAEDLTTSLPDETGRDAAKEIAKALGWDPVDKVGLCVDDANLSACSGPISDIDESLKPHVASPEEEDEAAADAEERRAAATRDANEHDAFDRTRDAAWDREIEARGGR